MLPAAAQTVPTALSLRPATARPLRVPWTVHAHATRAKYSPPRAEKSIQWFAPPRSAEGTRASERRLVSEQEELVSRKLSALEQARRSRQALERTVYMSQNELLTRERARAEEPSDLVGVRRNFGPRLGTR